ncbi:MAG: phage tail sheath subtilisin-like domain-containing protein [Campylobacteraceae bacterium]|jgi:phage tail sheath protein FI|nr:phage tail sheath subtilisin-like domain-containing protein [Campylobacteraceae bacterium]
MAAQFGVNATITAEAARPISIESITPIGIAGTAEGIEDELYFYGSVTAAKKALEAAEAAGSLLRAIRAIDEQSVETPIIFSVFTEGGSEGETTTACRNAIEAFRNASGEFGYTPNILIAPEYSHIAAVASTLQGEAERLSATGVVDLGGVNESAALTQADAFGTKRLILLNPKVKVYSEEQNDYVYEPLSARYAGLRAKTDGESEYGWADSASNRVLNGVFGTQRPVEFVMGADCEADRLRTAHIGTVIRQEGFRLWGEETTDQDTIWQDLTRVRVFDRVSEACQKGVFFAVDKKADQLLYAKLSVEELLRALKGASVLIGYDVEWNAAQNTLANITAGKFYLDVRMQNMPIVKTLELNFIYSDAWGEELMNSIG